MSAHVLGEETKVSIRQTLDAATADPKSQIPGLVAIAVNNTGAEIFSHASGLRGAETTEPMTLDSVFWIASCTKMVAGIACMQLVEQGKVALDDADMVGKILPEVQRAKILTGFDESDKAVLVEKKTQITLRHLLSHTAGFGYSFFDPDIRRFGLPGGIDEFSGRIEDIQQPLLFEPGTRFNYGTNIDWAGVLVERISGLSLHDYCTANIFAPLGIENMSFFPPAEMKAQLAYMHQRHPDGHLSPREHLLRAPLYQHNTAEQQQQQQKSMFNSAGAGLFAQPREYVKIIATLLNNGTSPTTGTQLLEPATVDCMFSNQIPHLPDFGRQPIQAARAEFTNPIAELYPQPRDQEQGWGLTFMLTIHEGATGRGSKTAWWAGLPNLFWWCDRERGVGGMVASQILPFADAQVMRVWAQVEAAVYQG